MATNQKYAHIKLGRAFRPHVLSTLKGLPSWPAYLSGNGFAGRSQDMTNDQVKDACEALGLDLDALYVAFFANVSPVTGMSSMSVDALRRENDNEADEAAPAMAHVTPSPDGIAPQAREIASDIEGFEGRSPDELIAELLAPASVHMTPHLAAMMPGLIRPLIEAAVRGPRVVTQTVTQVVDADGAVVHAPVVVPACKSVRKVNALTAFGLRKGDVPAACRYALDTIMLDICDAADAPAIDADYFWNCSALAELAAQDVMRLNAWLYGPAGTGKTEGVRQYAARLGRPFVRIAIERTTEPAELIGQEMPHKGSMRWHDGKLTRAFRIPHCVILIDEPTLLRSGTLAVLQTALDMRELHLTTGETVKAAEGVFIVAADNTAGCGDDSGRYVDTAPLNAAFMDRFALKTAFDFIPAAQETRMLAARAGVHHAVAAMMVEYAGLTRAQADSGRLTMGVSPRRLLAWARTARAGLGSARAFNAAIITGAAPEDREILSQLATTSLTSGHDRIDNIVRGLIDPNAPAVDPKAQGGVGATALLFPDADDDTL